MLPSEWRPGIVEFLFINQEPPVVNRCIPSPLATVAIGGGEKALALCNSCVTAQQ